MRKLIGALLAMTALMPAAASAQENRRERAGVTREARQEFRRERREDRRDFRREARSDGRDFVREARRDGREFRQERREDRDDLRRDDVTRREFLQDRRDDVRDYRADRRDDVRDYRRDRRDDVRDFRRDRRDDRRDFARGDNGWNNRDYGYRNNGAVWNRGWRNDGRYDWNRYRGVNRSAYRLPRYYAPGGWDGYRRFGVGVSLTRSLWGRNYWIGDPYAYRLPPAYGAYRWVRYYDDALLVDLRSGRVVDAVYGIFW